MELILTPGNGGQRCLGNGEHFDQSGNRIEICCDECDYLICCSNYDNLCDKCFEENGACEIKARHFT